MPGRDDVKEYRLRAQHCLDIATGLHSPDKLTLLEMAQAWLRLADQAERNRKNDVVYETPRRSQGNQHGAPKQGAEPD